MNTIEETTILSPGGSEEVCAKFVIDSVSKPYILSNIMAVSEQYTIHFFVKSESSGSIQISDSIFETSSEWKEYSATFIAELSDLEIFFKQTGTYYFYHPKLEIGNKATDYTEAPEDLESRVSVAESSIEMSAEEIKLMVRADSVISAINQSAEEISILASRIKLEGLVTANGNFKILEDGSMEARNGKFYGSLASEDEEEQRRAYIEKGIIRLDSGTEAHCELTGYGIDFSSSKDSTYKYLTLRAQKGIEVYEGNICVYNKGSVLVDGGKVEIVNNGSIELDGNAFITGDVWGDASSAERHIGIKGGKSQIYLYSRPTSDTTDVVWGIYDNTYGNMMTYYGNRFLAIYPKAYFLDTILMKNEGLLCGLSAEGDEYTLLKLSDTNTVNLGNKSLVTRLYGTGVYLGSTTEAVTSDERVKKDFGTLERFKDFYMSLKPVEFKYLAGTSDRFHIGFKAQDVKKALEDNGLTTQDFGGYVEEDVDKEYYMEALGYVPFEGKESALRYTEFIALNTYQIQRCLEEIKKIKEILNDNSSI